MSVREFARKANVPKGVLSNINSPKWNPEARTLKRLESVIPKNFCRPAKPKKSIKKGKKHVSLPD